MRLAIEMKIFNFKKPSEYNKKGDYTITMIDQLSHLPCLLILYSLLVFG
jgi:hypothetical protein